MTDCVITHHDEPCLQPRAHGGNCPGDSCPGCAPSPAVPGLLACAADVDAVREALRELPDLWAALLEPSTADPATGGTGPVDDAAQALPPAAAARTLIDSTLSTWCRVLEEEHGVPLPEERLIRERTRLDILNAQWDRDVELAAWRRPVDPARRAEHRRRAAEHDARRVELHRRGALRVDVIDALREHLDRHLRVLLADHAPDAAGGWQAADSGYREAQTFAEEILDTARRARGVAYPRRATVRIPCPCGAGRVALDPDQDQTRERHYTCPACGTSGTISDWRRLVAPNPRAPLPLSALPVWLADNHGLDVTYPQLRAWRDRGLLKALPCDPDGRPLKTGAAPAGSIAYRYDPEAVLVVARARLRRFPERRTEPKVIGTGPRQPRPGDDPGDRRAG